MLVSYEISLANFKAWSGAVATLAHIRDMGKCEELEAVLEELYPNGIDETTLNDILWFDSDWVFETLGIEEEY